MKRILVGIKRVVDYNVRVRVKPDNTGVVTDGVKMSVNPFDEIALEEALRIKERGGADEVVVATIGPADTAQQLRTALAMGADRAVRIHAPEPLEPLAIAKLLAALTPEEAPDLVFFGKQAVDDDSGQTGQMTAALLGWPQATNASAITLAGGEVEVAREVDGGIATVALGLPANVTTDLRPNQPRYATLPNVMKARQKPLAVRQAEEFGVDLARRLTVLAVDPPPARKPGVKLASVDELVNRLRAEAGVL